MTLAGFGFAFACAALSLSVVGAAAEPPSIVIRGDYKIGQFPVKGDGTLGGLITAFGEPAARAHTSWGCLARWPAVGLAVNLYNLGGFDPCSRHGNFHDAVLTGRLWVTAKGLRIGDSLARLQTLFPRARAYGAWRWLVARYYPVGTPGYYPWLEAKIVRGHVTAFRVQYPAGGD